METFLQDSEEPPQALQQEWNTKKHYLKQHWWIGLAAIFLAGSLIVLNHLGYSIEILKDVILAVIAILAGFVVFVVNNVLDISKQQFRTLALSSRLLTRFKDIQSRDNIIVPRDKHRILSIADISGLPTLFDLEWEKRFNEPISQSTRDQFHGCTMLFWPSIDDVINSSEYIKYFHAMSRFDFFRVLVTPQPKEGHEEGLRVYRELAKHFGTSVHVVDQDQWYGPIAEHFSSPAVKPAKWASGRFRKEDVTPLKLRVRELLQAQIEIVMDGPLADFGKVPERKWLVRYLQTDGLRCEHDQRMNLVDRKIEILSSAQAGDVAKHGAEIGWVLSIMLEMSRCYPDATKKGAADSIPALFSTAFADSLKECIDQIGAVRTS